jgi:hypothetical protein
MEKNAQQILTELREAGVSDEKMAVALGDELPGDTHPSSTSVRRWRTGKNQPSAVYATVIKNYAQKYWENQ